MEEKWIRDPLSAMLAGVAIIGFGLYAVFAAAGVAQWSEWWAYLLISVGFALAVELPIRMIRRSYRLSGLIFTRLLIGSFFILVGIGGILGFGEWWLALTIIAFGCTILTFGLWWWLGLGRR
jgi:hypothetical protein